MKKPVFLFIVSILITGSLNAGQLSGLITDDKGALLPYASVLVKGTGIGTTANDLGKYSLQLNPGKYILVCQYVGYGREEKSVTIANADLTLNFKLSVDRKSTRLNSSH